MARLSLNILLYTLIEIVEIINLGVPLIILLPYDKKVFTSMIIMNPELIFAMRPEYPIPCIAESISLCKLYKTFSHITHIQIFN